MNSPFSRWLEKLSDDPLQRRNLFWHVTAAVFTAAGTALTLGPVFQTFLVKTGLTEGQIGTYGSVAEIAYGVGMLALMGAADRVNRRVRAVVACTLAAALTPAVLLILCLLGAELRTAAVVFASMIALAIIQRPVTSFGVMVNSSLFVRLVHVNIRGRLVGISGFISGVIALTLGLVVAQILVLARFPKGFTICFAVAIPLYIAAALSKGKLSEVPGLQKPGRSGPASPWSAILDVLKTKGFRVLLGPNILRGLSTGFFYFAWIVGLKRLELPIIYTGLATSVYAIGGTILGSMAIGLLADRWGPGRVIFVGNALVVIGLMGLVMTNSPPVFLAFYALLAFGGMLEGAGIPLGCYAIAPPEVIGAFSGARFLLLSAGSAVSMSLVGHLLEAFDALPVFAAGAVLTLITGIWFWYAFEHHTEN